MAQTVATVNGKEISLKYLNKKMEDLKTQFPDRMVSKKQLLDDLVKRELGIQEAKRLKLDQDPDAIEQMESALFQFLIERKLKNELQNASISNSEAKSYYEKNREMRLAQIFIRIPLDADAALRKAAAEKVREIRKTLASGKTFAYVAQEFSEGLEAPAGGDLDFLTKDRMDPEIFAEAMRLKVGQISSKEIQTPFGLHIIRLVAVKTWNQVDKNSVKRLALMDRQKKVFDQYIDTLRNKGKVSINQKLL